MTEYMSTRESAAASPERFGVFRRWLLAILTDWRRRKMIEALERLDDKTLEDIGIDRGDIPLVVAAFDSRELRMTPIAR
jgi:uncharacterized protein YjiS (DUF1127 family)